MATDTQSETSSPGYRHVAEALAADRCVVLDGGVATELQRRRAPGRQLRDGELWGIWALYGRRRRCSRPTAPTSRRGRT